MPAPVVPAPNPTAPTTAVAPPSAPPSHVGFSPFPSANTNGTSPPPTAGGAAPATPGTARKSAAVKIARPDNPDQVVDLASLVRAATAAVHPSPTPSPTPVSTTSSAVPAVAEEVKVDRLVIGEAEQLARRQLQQNAIRRAIVIRRPDDVKPKEGAETPCWCRRLEKKQPRAQVPFQVPGRGRGSPVKKGDGRRVGPRVRASRRALAGHGEDRRRRPGRTASGRGGDRRAQRGGGGGNDRRQGGGDSQRDNGGRRERRDDRRGGRDRDQQQQHGARNVALLPEDLKPLEHSEARWVPETLAKKLGAAATPEGESPEELYVKQIEKRTRGLLNRLTPENMEKLQGRFVEPLESMAALKSITALIVKKSFDEPKYASLYAQLTLYMCRFMVPFSTMDQSEEAFKMVRTATRKLVITACHDQFQHRPTWADKSTGKISEEEFEEVVKIKGKALGNMRFVAELFNFQVISVKVMVSIVKELLQRASEEDLECLMTVMTTAGRRMDHAFPPGDMDKFFAILTNLIESQTDMLPRVRFGLMDLVALRRNGWAKPHGPQPTPQAAAAATSAGGRGGKPRSGTSTPTPQAAAAPPGWTAAPNRDASRRGAPRGQGTESPAPSGRGGPRGGGRDAHTAGGRARPNTFAALAALHAHDEPVSTDDEHDHRGPVSPPHAGRRGGPAASTASPAPARGSAVSSRQRATSPLTATTDKGGKSRGDGDEAKYPTTDAASARGEALARTFLKNPEPAEVVDEWAKVPASQARRWTAVDSTLCEVAMNGKLKHVAALAKALAMAVEEGLLAADEVVRGLGASLLVTEFADLKIDVPELGKMMEAVFDAVALVVPAGALDAARETVRRAK
ncbi:hypothetical protein AMAG_06125 [Allomyces macrogynus ATCC 38327]|uniref:MIF4G domain-containing protein n=1 Tax=Allomyces macrogynus (strain ATCC 38327) TaxID=578462 RepID=A0A0L0SEA0_ALLM3|nr:hypothetical protein AMAG_06125 [Allomyces macrogynus ATCC 38327]|eukprot:KNE60767.1 hypothetical protein AMAG_06125 [Allomyces macrogynus ATCC 38327]